MSETSDRIRREFKKSDDIRDNGLVSPTDVVRFDNIIYGQDAKWQILDVYRPKAVALNCGKYEISLEDARICNNEECDFFKEFVQE